MSDNYALDLLGGLDQSKSKKQINADIKTLEKTINMLRLTATLAQGSSKKELNAYIKQLSAQLSTIKLKAQIDSKNLKNEVNKALNNVSFKDIDALNICENKTKLKVQKVVADTRSYIERNPISLGVNIDSKRSKLDNDLTTYLNKYTKITESSVLLEEANKVRDLIDAITDKKSLTEATDAFRLFKSEVSATGYTSKSTADKVKSMLSHITKIGSAFGVASMLINNFTQSLKTLRENDTILTEISKTSEMTKNQLKELGDEAFKIASKYGQLSSNFLLATQEMARAGYDDNVKGMAELSTKAQGAGDMTAELSNQYIIATDKAFKMNGSIETLTATLDGANNITNNNALAMADLAEAMSIVGSQAASSGMEVNETTAAVATMIAVTQRSGSEAANAFKGILMNLRQVSGDVGDGEDIIDADSLTKYEKACAELGVSLSTVKDGVVSLKEPMQIIKELAEAYTQLDEADAKRANLLNAVGGKYRANALNAILENYDMYEKMLKEYADGLGSMDAEAEKTAKSWEGRLAALQNSWDSFINTLTNKEAIMGGISFLDRLIQGAETFVDTFGTIPTVLTAINSSMVAMKKDYGLTKIWDAESKKVDLEGNLFGIDISKIKNLKKHYEEAAVAISDWNCELLNGKTNLDIFENACVKNSVQLKEYLSTCSKDAPASLKDYRQYLESTGQATEDLRLKTILLNTALTFLGSLAIQIVITGIAKAFDKFNETVEESQGKVDDINSKISDLKTQIEELNSLEYKSDFDKQKILQLERELELQQKILEVEQKRLYQNQVGTKFSDYFDADSLVTKQHAEEDRYNKEGYKYLSIRFEADKESLADIDAELTSLQSRLDNGLSGHERFEVEGKIEKLTEKRNKLLEEQQSIEEQLTLNMGDYLKDYQTAQEAVDSGLLTGSDLEKAESMAEYWNQMYQDSNDIVTNIQKINGTYDNTNDLLDEKFGGISREDLALLSDEDKRIALSFDPDNAIGFEELQQKIAETKDDIEELNATKISTFEDAWADSYISESDAVKELADNLLELAEQGRLTIETFNEADSTDYFKNLGISADEAISKINKMVDESKQLSSMASQISSISDALSTKLEDGFVSADTLSGFDAEVRGLESWDRFQEVLGSTTSSYEECQEAANALATEWVNDSNFLAQLTDENKEYYKTQLQAMGVENYEELISYAQALNEAKEVLAQSSLMLGEATQDEIEAMIAEGQYSELTANMILTLYDAKIAEQAATIDTATDCENLIALAGDTDRTSRSIELLVQLMDIYSGLESGAYNGNRLLREEALAEVDRIKSELEALANGENEGIEMEPTVKLGSKGKSAASKAGSAAADAYLEAFEKELEELETLRDQGKITEKEYLDYLRKLYEKYFKNIDKYAKNFAENQAKYLEGMKSLYESALSGITSILDKQISAYEDSKSAAVDALEAERDAAIEAKEAEKARYEEEIKSIDKEIDAKEKAIDSINDEINAIREANDERQRQLDLQKAQYELERMQNQKTILQYSSDKGMHYVTDTSGVADAKDAVEDAQTEITIANKEKEIDLIEKEIDLLEERKDLINEQIDLLDEQIDQINEQYDKLIADTEKYWDNLIKGMEDYKSRWEELAEIEEQAKIIETLRSLGIETDDILNMSEEAFARFKDEYIGILADIYSGNDSMLSALSDTTGRSVDEMGSYITATQGYIDSLSGIGESLDPVAEAIGNVDENMGSLSSTASEANTNLSETTSATNEIADNVGSIADNLNQIPDSQNIMNLSNAFSNLAESIGKVAQALGISDGADINTLFQAMTELNDVILGNEGEGIIGQFTLLKNAITDVINTIGLSGEQTVGSLMQAIDGLNTITLSENIITQFNNLKAAIDSVTSAISGGGGSSDGEGTSGGESISGTFKGGKQAKKGFEGGGGNSLTGAIESIGDTANKVIGAPEATGDGTVIGEFGSLETAVNDVTAAIGSGGSESGEGQDTEGSDNLTDSITGLGITTKDTLGESGGDGVIGRFEKFKDVIGEADEHVSSIYEGLTDIDNTTVECTIKVHIESDGSIPNYASGTALGAMNLESAEYNAKYEGSAHVSGTANVTGNWGVKKPGKSLVGEIGQEIWVHSADGTFETVGDNGPEWIKTEKGDLIFNHLQTKELLDKGNIVKTGKAYANGNIQYSDGTVIRPNGEVLEPLQPGDKMYDMLQKFKVYMDSIDNNVEKLSSHITYEHSKQINEVVNQITNSSVVNNNRNQPVTVNQNVTISCPNVTNDSGIEYVQKQLGHLSQRALQEQLRDY